MRDYFDFICFVAIFVASADIDEANQQLGIYLPDVVLFSPFLSLSSFHHPCFHSYVLVLSTLHRFQNCQHRNQQKRKRPRQKKRRQQEVVISMDLVIIVVCCVLCCCCLRIFKDRQLRRTGHRGSTDQPQIPITVVHLSSVSSVSEPGSRAVSELRIGISTVVPSADHVNPVRLLSARVSDRIRQQQQHHQEEEEDGPRDFEEYVLEDIDALPAYERPSSPLTAQEHPVTELRFQVEGLSETIDAPPEYSPREEEDPAAPPSTVSIPMPADAESEPQPSPPNSDTTCPLAGSATS
ncbi:hypothetical protein EDD21DRAFT_376215 [Dissophora ornata]|nr:hypothetical protein EDD21DRAFT_376215 [Dissophora ornata]